MSWLSARFAGPTVLEAHPADALPGDALLWVAGEPSEAVHRVIEVGMVWRDVEEGRVRVVSPGGREHLFDPTRVVALIRHSEGPLARSRATDPQQREA